MQRIMYSAAKAVSEHLYSGQNYSKAIKLISVNIVYFDLGIGKDYIYVGTTNFKGFHFNELELSQKQRNAFAAKYPSDIFPKFYLLKVNNFDDHAKTHLDEWIYFLKNSRVKDYFTAQGTSEAKKSLDILNMSVGERQGA